MITAQKYILWRNLKFYDILANYIERDYKNSTVKKIELVRKVFIDENKWIIYIFRILKSQFWCC